MIGFARKRLRMFLEKIFPFRKKQKKQGLSDALMNAFTVKYVNFKTLLESNSELLKIISSIEEKLRGDAVFGMSFVNAVTVRIVFHVARMVQSFETMSGRKYPGLIQTLNRIHEVFRLDLEQRKPARSPEFILHHDGITKEMTGFVGGKNANLGEVLTRLHLPIPAGFAITTTAFDRFIEANDLGDEIRRRKMELDLIDPEIILRVSEGIQELFLEAKVPQDLEKAIMEAYTELAGRKGPGQGNLKIALRSSAIGEDSELSFAGQYLSVLNVPAENIVHEYKRVLASLFTPQAITYRLHMGITFEDAAMSVACLEMVPARVSGVMYTRHPFNFLEDHVIINAVWGLGPYAVEGVVTPDMYTVSKGSPPVLLDSKISPKRVRLVAGADGYIAEDQVDEKTQKQPCLTGDQAVTLASYAKVLEEHFGCPQDIEWAIDQNNKPVILQTRPLRLERNDGESPAFAEPVPGYTMLLEGGDIVCPGVGSGPAHIVRSMDDLMSFPDGGVLVAVTSSPQYVIVMQKAQAILADSGSITGHMASLARDFRIPAILNTRKATSAIQQGAEVTVDAYSGRVYLGKVPELMEMRVPRGSFMKNTPVYEILRKRADLIIPLNLVDPKSPEFAPRNCKTVHDIMRLLHEFSYTELFQLSDLATDYGSISVRLDAPIPLELFIIDLGKGISDVVGNPHKVTPDEITSIPFAAVLKGMLHDDLRRMEPRPVNLRGFFSVMSQQVLTAPNMGGERFGDRSYAIISDQYLNFSSRVGYHYSILDTFCGPTPVKNHINFQFKGGAADDVRRNRRARLIRRILEELGFIVEVVADRVTGRLLKQEQSIITDKLDHLGRLLIFTRQMDMLMSTEDSVNRLAECFLNGDYSIESYQDQRATGSKS
jgi:pyruvate,water dikinase